MEWLTMLPPPPSPPPPPQPPPPPPLQQPPLSAMWTPLHSLAACLLLRHGSPPLPHLALARRTGMHGTVFLGMHGFTDGAGIRAGLVLSAPFRHLGLRRSTAPGCICPSSSARQGTRAASSCLRYAPHAALRCRWPAAALAASPTLCAARWTRRPRRRRLTYRGSSLSSTLASSSPLWVPPWLHFDSPPATSSMPSTAPCTFPRYCRTLSSVRPPRSTIASWRCSTRRLAFYSGGRPVPSGSAWPGLRTTWRQAPSSTPTSCRSMRVPVPLSLSQRRYQSRASPSIRLRAALGCYRSQRGPCPSPMRGGFSSASPHPMARVSRLLRLASRPVRSARMPTPSRAVPAR